MITHPTASPRDRTREDLYRLVLAGGAVTRSELVELTGMSRSTINNAIGRLLTEGRILETDAEVKGPGSGSGRPGIRLKAVAARGPIAGIDFGHNHVHVAVAGGDGTPLGDARVPLDVDLRASEAMDLAARLLKDLCSQHDLGSVTAVVAGIPGPIDTRTGLVRSPTILSSWVGLAPGTELSQRLGTHVVVENDAVLGAYGELQRGAGRHFRDFLYVKASHGVGAGLVIDGETYKGATGLAGEIGHTHLVGESQLCRCGNRGCLEAVVSVDAIRSQLAHTRPNVDPRTLRLEADDVVTQRVLSEAGRTLGRVLATLCNLLNPAALIVGGDLGAAGEAFIGGVEASIRRHAQPATAAAMEVLPAALGSRAELTGALQLAVTRAVR